MKNLIDDIDRNIPEKYCTLITVSPSTTPISRNCTKIVPDMAGRIRALALWKQSVSSVVMNITSTYLNMPL